ncbi:TlpA disulfide reductase family protein [Aurantimonas sp. VKM B-3413]|uniref:TlpA disulfide reductase family protein n=1 Tax=Aurantimonas sp. VKM B-3413 TaxID=2779401 RepID=UPI001E5DEE8E|nr:TlpA disulfide reductase family protein [Aurantimonas sp. VKM B-3413]MCB8839767.1 TlpA family protein disulfide reductase [Aurantimonas sp. VKM B-3413]
MTALAVGPFIFAGDRLAAVVAIVAFLGISAILSARVDDRIGSWSLGALAIGIVAARAGHVLLNLSSFAVDPWRVLMVWQGGFSLPIGLVAAVAVSLFQLREAPARIGSLGSLAAAILVWNIAFQLVASTTALAAPSASMTTLSGSQLRLSDFAGRPVVVNLWASWCPPCRREMPTLMQTAKKRTNTAFVLANQGEGAGAVVRFLSASGLSTDHVALDQDMALARHYGVQGFPVTLFLNRKGVLQSVHFGEISVEALNGAIDALQRDQN